MATSLNNIDRVLDVALEGLEKSLPGLQRAVLEQLLQELRGLDLTAQGVIKPTATNLRKVMQLSRTLDKFLTSDKFIERLRGLPEAIDKITTAQDRFYKQFFKEGRPPAIAREIRAASRNQIVNDMTVGLSGEVFNSVKDTINAGIVSGQTYDELTNSLRNTIYTNTADGGLVEKYARQIATDSLNGYTRNYGIAVTQGLDFQWYRYTGTNIKTTRDFCRACKIKEYIHVSEFPKVIKGDFPEFKAVNGKIYEPYGLPQGMRKETTPETFRNFAGGYNCRHQLRPVYERMVPKSIRDLVYNTDAYKTWQKDHKKAL